jgi:hypothetical protein
MATKIRTITATTPSGKTMSLSILRCDMSDKLNLATFVGGFIPELGPSQLRDPLQLRQWLEARGVDVVIHAQNPNGSAKYVITRDDLVVYHNGFVLKPFPRVLVQIMFEAEDYQKTIKNNEVR